MICLPLSMMMMQMEIKGGMWNFDLFILYLYEYEDGNQHCQLEEIQMPKCLYKSKSNLKSGLLVFGFNFFFILVRK